MKPELERIKQVYKRYKESTKYKSKWDSFNPGNIWIVKEREEKVVEPLEKHNFRPLSDKRTLDVGCGRGGFLRNLLKYTAGEDNLYGIDLSKDRLWDAKREMPGVNFCVGNGECIPFKDRMFDIVIQFTLFTSILDEGMKKNIAKEMLRVLKDDGVIIWYDFRYSNPSNPNVRGMGKREINSLFPNCKFDFEIITLLPPLARKFAKYSLAFCELLKKLPFLRTHYLVTIRK